jgi:glutathione S-transferase
MHSSFAALRGAMPMNIRASHPGKGRKEGVDQDIARVTEIWRECRAAASGDGDFLFGAWSAADAMYAPVASRFKTYAVTLDDVSQHYADAVLASAYFKAWEAEALKETSVVPEDEIDMVHDPIRKVIE